MVFESGLIFINKGIHKNHFFQRKQEFFYVEIFNNG